MVLGDVANNYSTVFIKSSNTTNANGLSTECYANYTMNLCGEGGTYAIYGVGRNIYGQLGLGKRGTSVLTLTKSITIGDITPNMC